MAIVIDKQAQDRLKEIVGRRLKAARKATGLSESAAAQKIGHKGVTQISLAESGERLPTLSTIVELCNLYCVPVDYVVGRIDDPIAEVDEIREGLITLAVAKSTKELFSLFAKSVAQQAAVTIAGYRKDRYDLLELVQLANEAKAALARIKELNPEYDDEVRGASKLEAVLTRMQEKQKAVDERIGMERRKNEVIERTIRTEQIEARIEQFMLDLRR